MTDRLFSTSRPLEKLESLRQEEARVREAMEWYCLRRMGLQQDESLTYSPSDLRLLTNFSAVVEKGGYETPGLLLGMGNTVQVLSL